MSNTGSHSTLREWRRHLIHPLTLTALAGAGAVLTLIGPFGTLSSLSILPRAGYWTTLTFAGYIFGYLISYGMLRRPGTGMVHLLRVLAAGVVTGSAMTALVSVLNGVVFGVSPLGNDLFSLASKTIVISVIVMAVIDLFSRHLRTTAVSVPMGLPAPPILNRLTLDKRGPLVALSVEDHYVRVRTTRGEEMLLMRLADAIREVDPTLGAQVHRSHWAAFDQVTSATRLGDRAVLTMTKGDDIPVSRRHIPTLKEAGLLPR